MRLGTTNSQISESHKLPLLFKIQKKKAAFVIKKNLVFIRVDAKGLKINQT